MPPRRHTVEASGPAVAAAPSLLSLPDAVLVECLQFLGQKERLQHVALVNKRLRELCLAPQLLRTLHVQIFSTDGSAVVRRSQALLELFTAHARHVRRLHLDVQLPAAASDAQQLETAALVTGCLAACGAAGGELETLLISSETPLGSTAWLSGLTNLQRLRKLGSPDHPLQLNAGISKLTALHSAHLFGQRIELSGSSLPPCLTYLNLEGIRDNQPLPRVSNLSSLERLVLYSCLASEESLRQLTALPLRQLELVWSSLPPCLSQLTRLTLLAASDYTEEELPMVDASLPHLTSLRRLALAPRAPDADHRLPNSVTTLLNLTRFFLQLPFSTTPMRQQLPSGAWLASLEWLGLPYHTAAAAAVAGVLSGMSQLQYFCCSGWPEEGDADEDADWDAFWRFLERHPPLRCFAVDTESVPVSAAAPSAAAVDALVDLSARRRELQIRTVPRYDGGKPFWRELLDFDEIPAGTGA